MKNIINKIAFSIRFAFKNIIKYKLRSLLLIFSFISLIVITLLGFSTKPLVENYYYEKYVVQYKNIDLYMSISQNSNARYFSIRSLKESNELNNLVDDYYPFFEIQSLININNEKCYVNIMSSDLDNFKKVSSANLISNLNSSEVVITNSFASKYNLKINDNISINIKELSKEYRIIAIIEDNGLFYGDKIYLNKDYFLQFFLKTINPDLGDLNPIFFANLYNRVYFDVKTGIDSNLVQNRLQEIEDYNLLEIKNPVNYQKINQLINRNLTLFFIIFMFIYLAIFFVLRTTLVIIFEEKQFSFRIINILGGLKIYALLVLLIETLFFFIISSITAIYLTNIIIKYGLDYVELNSSYILEKSSIISSLILIFIIYSIITIYLFFKYNKYHTNKLEENSKYNKIIISFFLVLSIYLVLEFINYNQLNYLIIIKIILIILGSILFAFVLLQIFIKILSNIKKESLIYFNLKILLSKKTFKHYAYTILMCFFTIFLILESYYHQINKTKLIVNEYNIDFALTNIINNYDSIYQEIISTPNVDSVDSALMYQGVSLVDANYSFDYLISLPSKDITNYFNLKIDNNLLEKLNQDQPMILLPTRFNQLNGYEIGEKIIIYISPSLPQEEFIIGGFFDKELSNIAFSNINKLEKYKNEKPNAIFVNGKEDRDLLKEMLINKYSENMVFVIDFKELIQKTNKEIIKIINYLSYLFLIIVACFLLSIFNHTILLFENIRQNYAKIYLIGASRHKLMQSVLIKHFFIFLIFFITSLLSYILLSNNLTELIIFFNQYENINRSFNSIIDASLICGLIYFFSIIIYLFKLSSIKIVDFIKTY